MGNMWFWWIMFFAGLLIPAAMVIFGRVIWKHPSKEIGRDSCGYRTAMSQKNQETWDFAQHACGRIWWKGGWMLLVISVGAQLPFRGCDAGTVGKAVLVLCVFQCVCMVGTVVLVELVLRRNFYDDGRRKEGNAADLQKSEPF